jgi:hypothetical protein
VLGTVWSVAHSPDLAAEEDSWGQCSRRTRTIVLDPIAEQPVTLLHELLHAIAHAQGLEDLREEHIHGLARGLTAVLADNSALRRWLLQP